MHLWVYSRSHLSNTQVRLLMMAFLDTLHHPINFCLCMAQPSHGSASLVEVTFQLAEPLCVSCLPGSEMREYLPSSALVVGREFCLHLSLESSKWRIWCQASKNYKFPLLFNSFFPFNIIIHSLSHFFF